MNSNLPRLCVLFLLVLLDPHSLSDSSQTLAATITPLATGITHWDFLQEAICQAVRGFLDGSLPPDGFCDSVIVLIPKTINPDESKKPL